MSLRNALLGLLNYQPMTGYDLKTIFDESINHFWTASGSQIYRDLGQLEQEGLVTSHIEPQEGKPDRRIYTITEEGQQVFDEWLNDFPEKSRIPIRYDFLVRVFFGSRIPIPDLKFQLQKYVREKHKELESYHHIEKDVPEHEDRFYWGLTIRLGVLFSQAELTWAEEALKELTAYEEIKKSESGQISN